MTLLRTIVACAEDECELEVAEQLSFLVKCTTVTNVYLYSLLCMLDKPQLERTVACLVKSILCIVCVISNKIGALFTSRIW